MVANANPVPSWVRAHRRTSGSQSGLNGTSRLSDRLSRKPRLATSDSAGYVTTRAAGKDLHGHGPRNEDRDDSGERVSHLEDRIIQLGSVTPAESW